jgi:hypothetical protein
MIIFCQLIILIAILIFNIIDIFLLLIIEVLKYLARLFEIAISYLLKGIIRPLELLVCIYSVVTIYKIFDLRWDFKVIILYLCFTVIHSIHVSFC